jgi:co-chaperonin GroES (HSP10)
MDLTVTREKRVICEECGNADGNHGLFMASDKVDNRLSKDNLKFYKVKWVKGDGNYPKISLKVGDVVMTEALGIDITLEGKKYKVFDTDFIVAKVDENA